MDVSVIISTYNNPRWLEKVIWGFEAQDYQDFEVIIADDGSGEETRSIISRLREEMSLAIHHVWHEDRGFRKCEILNKAIIASSHDYLVFVDGDCVPRRDFLETHVDLATKGRFLSGGIVRLSKDISRRLTKQDIQQGRAFDPVRLQQYGVEHSKKLLLLEQNLAFANFLNAITTTRPSFNGHNASVWKEDMLRINGFDERMRYGGLDREVGERLVNSGIRGRQIRHRAGCIHLNHSRNYERSEDWRRNHAIRAITRKTRACRTNFGIVKSKTTALKSLDLHSIVDPTTSAVGSLTSCSGI